MDKLKHLEREKEELMQQQKESIETNKSLWHSNDIIVYENHAEVYLRNNKNKLVGITLIDREDIDKVKLHKWHLGGKIKTVAETMILKKVVKLHRFLMNAQEGQIIDHINRKQLDNRKENLRFCTIKENNNNKNPYKKNMKKVFLIYHK